MTARVLPVVRDASGAGDPDGDDDSAVRRVPQHAQPVPGLGAIVGGSAVDHDVRLPLAGSGDVQPWVELALATPVVLYCAWPFFVRFVASVRNRAPNMWTLIGLGVGAAYAYSVIAVLRPEMFPESLPRRWPGPGLLRGSGGDLTLTLLGQVLELRARASTADAIKGLLDLAPKTARRINADGTEEDVALAEVVVGDRIRVRPGEKVPGGRGRGVGELGGRRVDADR